MVVGVEIQRPPMNHRPAAGRIVEVLGFPDEPGIDLKTIIRKYDLREDYPPDVLAEAAQRSEEHTSELQSPCNLVCRLLLEKKKKKQLTPSDTRRHSKATHSS